MIVQATPHFLRNGEIELASQLITGSAGCYLPIVYMSAPFNKANSNSMAYDLAKELSGMAHVVVEPNRPFSHRLRIDVAAENVNGGAIGIYWPNSEGGKSVFKGGSPETKKAILNNIKDALTNRLPLTRCSWFFVQEEHSKKAYQQLKTSGSLELDKYLEGFEAELQAKEEQRKYDQNEIERLKAEIRKLEARKIPVSGVSLSLCEEGDLYESEIFDFVIDAIREQKDRVVADSRRQHIFQALLNENTLLGEGDKMKEKIKKLLKDYKSMNAKVRQELKEMGFEISEEGKHYKLCFRNDDRYTFVLAKTGSDNRGGMNAAADISRLLF